MTTSYHQLTITHVDDDGIALDVECNVELERHPTGNFFEEQLTGPIDAVVKDLDAWYDDDEAFMVHAYNTHKRKIVSKNFFASLRSDHKDRMFMPDAIAAACNGWIRNMDSLNRLNFFNKLPVEKRILYSRRCKNKWMAYLLLVFIGGIGAHRFYLGRAGTGICILALTIIGFFHPPVYIALALWLILDLFYINQYINTHCNNILLELSKI